MINNDPLFDEELQAVLSHDGVDRCSEGPYIAKKRKAPELALAVMPPADTEEVMDAEWTPQSESISVFSILGFYIAEFGRALPSYVWKAIEATADPIEDAVESWRDWMVSHGKITAIVLFLIFIVGLLSPWLIPRAETAEPEAIVEPILATEAAQPAQVAAVTEPPVTEPVPVTLDDAALIAKAWYGFGNYYSDEVLESFVDFVDNRVQAGLYGATSIEDVILRPKQWVGWSESNPVIERTYEKVKAILEDRANGGMRSIPTSLLYFRIEANGITYMTEFGSGQTWYVGE